MAHLAGQLQAQAVRQRLNAKLAARVRCEKRQRYGPALRTCSDKKQRCGAASCKTDFRCGRNGVQCMAKAECMSKSPVLLCLLGQTDV